MQEHAARTLDAVRRAIAHVPFYAKQGLTAPDALEGLSKLPLLTAERVRVALPKAWMPDGRDAKAELASGTVAVVEIGVGAGRARWLLDAAWRRMDERRAMTQHPRVAAALAGELGPFRDAVLGVPERGTGSCGSGDPEYEERLEGDRLHLNPRQDPTFWSDLVMTRMLDELARHETIGLVADPFYLDVLARHAAVLGRRLDVRGYVALGRALATAAHRAAIRRVFTGLVLDVYGSRAAGTLFVEGEDGKMHHAPFSHVELLRTRRETPGARDVALVVVTTLDRDVQPLVRWATGDLVQVAEGDAGAANATGVAPLASVEGALDDALVRPDGAIVTAGAIDRALAPLELRAYQIVQREPAAAELEVVGGARGAGGGSATDAARDALASLLAGTSIVARAVTAIAVDPDGKYRSTRRQFPLALTEVFA
jgi:phenylacetate-CoA ligase